MACETSAPGPGQSRELAEAVGRLLIVGFEGTEFPEVEDLIGQVRPAGLIFFKRNFPETDGARRLRKLIDSAQALAESLLGRRLFMAIDHEGGLVQRLSAPYTKLPAAFDLPDQAAAAELAGQGARELAATGFNFNLAPVLDVARPAGGFIGSRSFGADPELVLARARVQLAAFHRAGVLGAGKHFPGLGSAVIDPHHDLPTLEAGLDELRAVDLPPFRGLIEGVPALEAVMTTHAFFPALDPRRPATFSTEIVMLLKAELNFGGALLTDDLEMGAVTKNYPLGQAAVEAVRAGHDLALVCRRRDYVDECRRALAGALADGRLSEARLAEAHGRSEALARRLDEIQPDPGERERWFKSLTANDSREGGIKA